MLNCATICSPTVQEWNIGKSKLTSCSYTAAAQPAGQCRALCFRHTWQPLFWAAGVAEISCVSLLNELKSAVFLFHAGSSEAWLKAVLCQASHHHPTSHCSSHLWCVCCCFFFRRIRSWGNRTMSSTARSSASVCLRPKIYLRHRPRLSR